MTKDQRFMVAAKTAYAFGPALTLVSVLGVARILPLGAEALRAASSQMISTIQE